jgi:hypothetical protein
MRVAREFVRHIHQDVGVRIAGLGIEDQVEFNALRVL